MIIAIAVLKVLSNKKSYSYNLMNVRKKNTDVTLL